MPRGVPNKKNKEKKERITNTGRQALPEPRPSTRLEQVKAALAHLDFGFTIFFANERGESIKYYSGAVLQDHDPRS